MKRRILLLLLVCSAACGNVNAQNPMEDTTFFGFWVKQPGSGVFQRSSTLTEAEGFQLTNDGKLLHLTPVVRGKAPLVKGTWWSVSIGHFSIRYYDSWLEKEIVESFQYASGENTTSIQRIGREEQIRMEDSRFAGTYWKELRVKGDAIMYVQCDELESRANGFYLSAEGRSTRRLLPDAKKKESIDQSGTWTNNVASDQDFDLSYFSTAKQCIVMEHFSLVFPETTPVRIVRTSCEELNW